jgi:uncharacterized protein YdeI (YjbR/CyaY-like superfamily)
MSTRDPRVDAYIARSADFARPVLNHIRKLVHAACPEAVETIKWNFPHFDYQGMLCGMAAFKEHCSLGFWKGALIFGDRKEQDEAMGQFGRITSLADLPADGVLLGYLRKAAQLNEAGIKLPPRKPRPKQRIIVPADLRAALKKNKRALANFENFSSSHRREYVEWISEAKRAETRRQRLRATVEWLAEGKPRNWKYTNC